MPDRRIRLLFAAAGVVATALLPPWPEGAAAEGMTADGAAASGTAMLDEDAKARLLAQATARGELPVIVGFVVADLPVDEEGADVRPPDPTEAEQRRTAIARVRARLLAELGVRADRRGVLSGPGVHTVKVYETIPFLALTVEPEPLARLLANPLVSSVQPDAAVPPL